jgi:signal transduction histidine kinase
MSEGRSPAGRLLAMLLAAVPAFLATRAASSSPVCQDGGGAQTGDGGTVDTLDVDRMVRLLDNALSLARGTPNPQARDVVEVGALIGEIVQEQDSERLTFAGTAAPVNTFADATALGQLFQILIKTALAAASRATVRIDHGTSALVVHVDDNGPGIPRGERARMLDPTPQLTSSTGGEGLPNHDLVVALRLARWHGGDLSIASSPEGGARFTVRLPIMAMHEIELAAAS